ncbi:hypothetical protein [Vibrio sonorensis]|uniref:hypothetical protein n=1 Tax=Vibrio sonorensis TaxID=1004316 RepID=UPI0008DAD649|nr:hypothetical protein [Vibrio sonorensis]
MLERVEQIAQANDLKYKTAGNAMTIKWGGAIGGRVKIKYRSDTNSYLYSCGEIGAVLSGLVFFTLAFNTLYQPSESIWTGYLAGLFFFIAVQSLLDLVLSHIQLLDLKPQLRAVGINLKSGVI